MDSCATDVLCTLTTCLFLRPIPPPVFPPARPPVCAAPEEEVEGAVQIFVDAFREDMGMAAFSGGSARVQRDIFRRTLHACLARGEVYLALADGAPRGVAAALAPGADWAFYEQEDFMRELSAYLEEWYSYHYVPTYEELYRNAFVAGPRARRDAWNLKYLAVAPALQRRGLGRALVAAVCKQADAGAKNITADVKSPHLVQWFRKSGFAHRAVKNFAAKDSAGFPLWCMVREPAGETAHQL
ncbi:acyl-CoA N-acyltransferase [Trametes elegans]|nr:acyl-CoA N-acyltransferase [Trametes elegans]